MKRSIFGAFITGCAVSYFTNKWYHIIQPNKGIDQASLNKIHNYVNQHNLKTMNKVTLMKSYMSITKSFLDYGLIEKLKGFSFYQIYFNYNEQIPTKIYCIFSPKDQLCGHPSIQHGGVTATIVDQTIGMLSMIYSRNIVATAELNVKYLHPIRVGQIYILNGEIIKKEGRKIYVQAEIVDIITKEKVASSKALFINVKWQHKMAEVFRYLFGIQEQ